MKTEIQLQYLNVISDSSIVAISCDRCDTNDVLIRIYTEIYPYDLLM